MELTVDDVVNSHISGAQDPVVTVRSKLDAIAASSLNALISVLEQSALADAKALAHDGPSGVLCGVVVAVKDLIDVAGARTTMGSEQFFDNVAATDAEVVRRLRAAGAIIIGKTNTHQFAYGSTGDRSHAGPVRNPHDPTRMTGGSSSGSAAAVAANLAHAAIGTDTSASVRLPAALCGLVGIKPTLGLVPTAGIFPLSHTLDHVGPITRNCRDNARMLAVLADRPADHYLVRIGQSISGKTVGLPDRFYGSHLSPDVKNTLDSAARYLEARGARIVTVPLPDIQTFYEAQQRVLRVEAYVIHEAALEGGRPFDPEVQERLIMGKDERASDYVRALALRKAAKVCFDRALETADVLLTATCGITAPTIEQRVIPLNGEEVPTRWLLTRLTVPTNLSGHPSLSVPFGTDGSGLPIGLQLIGPYHGEDVLYQFGDVLERRA